METRTNQEEWRDVREGIAEIVLLCLFIYGVYQFVPIAYAAITFENRAGIAFLAGLIGYIFAKKPILRKLHLTA